MTRVPATLPFERRRASRFDVTRKFISVDLGEDHGGLLLNLSDSGAAVQMAGRMLPGTSSKKFSFASGEQSRTIEGRAVVAWVANSGRVAGIRFERLFPGSESELNIWLQRCALQKMQQDPPAPSAQNPSQAPMQKQVATLPIPPNATAPKTTHSLAELVQRTRDITRADGASIALKDSNGSFVCICSAGFAPEVGCAIRTDYGLSAECIASGRPVICEDASRDDRINPEARGELGSATIIPLRDTPESPIFGLYALFSRQPNAFSTATMDHLHAVISTIGPLAKKQVP